MCPRARFSPPVPPLFARAAYPGPAAAYTGTIKREVEDMDDRQRRRWTALLVLLGAAGAALLTVCSRFAGFADYTTTPLVLAAVCAFSGLVLTGCWLRR